MTNDAGVQRPAPKLDRLDRWRLTEPLNFYFYGWSLLLLLASTTAAVLSGFWEGPATVLLVVLLQAPAVWAARKSVYSPRGLLVALREAFENR
jgi:hypothetical protein